MPDKDESASIKPRQVTRKILDEMAVGETEVLSERTGIKNSGSYVTCLTSRIKSGKKFTTKTCILIDKSSLETVRVVVIKRIL